MQCVYCNVIAATRLSEKENLAIATDKGEAPKLYYSSFHYIYLHWCTCKLLYQAKKSDCFIIFSLHLINQA